jgi:UDP-N-acetylmuramate: L-alanyl-gamma-D-glutamyl-meso-diaminopimelate ligase
MGAGRRRHPRQDHHLGHAGLDPRGRQARSRLLVGGIPQNFGISARLTDSPFFVIEADEYDTAFFDKRSKFVHYRPRTVILNNLEYDHADIFADLAAIETQFHHLVRTVPGNGLILAGAHSPAVDAVLAMGCWSAVQRIGDAADWDLQPLAEDYSAFRILRHGACFAEVEYGLFGPHNAANACAAAAIGAHLGLDGRTSSAALASFQAPKRRLELLGTPAGVPIYDDFAHHPTAVALSLAALAARHPQARLVAVLEPRSNTMRMGVHRDSIAAALAPAGLVFIHEPPGLGWDIRAAVASLGDRVRVEPDIEALAGAVATACRDGDVVVVMSNGAFGGIHGRIIELLDRQSPHTGSASQ